MSRQSNMIASLRSNPVLAMLILTLVLAVAGVILAVFKIQASNNEIQSYLKMVDDMRVSAYRAVDNTRQAMGGSDFNFDELDGILIDMDDI